MIRVDGSARVVEFGVFEVAVTSSIVQVPGHLGR